MCGIAGFVDSSVNQDQAEHQIFSMLKAIHHRGPESSNASFFGPVTLGHNRLKIIDLSDAANQPFHYHNVTVVFNGEIYNYRELRLELQSRGFTFQTQSDTEVLCASWVCWGEECVQHFVGMWAFALYDSASKKLFCSRDRFGVKPFFWFRVSGGFYFASEVKALRQLPFFPAGINTSQLIRGIQSGQVCFREETFHSAVHQLQPGYNLQFHDGKIQEWCYYTIPVSVKSSMTMPEKIEEFRRLFQQSITLHSRSDVRNGICLSGGLDSSSIASMFSTLYPETDIQSFTIYYEGAGAVDERPFVHSVAEKYPNIKPEFYSPSDKDIEQAYNQCVQHADVPLLGSTYLSQYFLMQLAASKGVTVVLDGQGADEYLAGYLHSFHRMAALSIQQGNPGTMFQLMKNMAMRENLSFRQVVTHWAKSFACLFFSESSLQQIEWEKGRSQYTDYTLLSNKPISFSKDRLDDFLLHLIYHTTLPTLLHFEDKNSMAFSLESRVPFLDHRLVEFGFQLLPEDRLSSEAETKYILREALKDILPQKVYARKDKKGFVTPGEIRWLNGPLRFLLHPNRIHPFFKKDFVLQLIRQYQSGDISQARLLWRMLTTNDWLLRND